VLGHSGGIGVLPMGFWRFLLSPHYGARRRTECREACTSFWGTVAVGAEILLALLAGLGVPVFLALVMLWNR